MTHVQELIRTNPSATAVDAGTLAECIEACFECARARVACADACLGESDVADLRRCVILNLDCADMCEATGKILSH